MEHEDTTKVGHTPCISPDCDSETGLGIFVDDQGELHHGWCFSCETRFTKKEMEAGMPLYAKKEPPQTREINNVMETIEEILKYPIAELTDRGISKKAAEYFGIRVSFNEQTGQIERHYYPYYKEDGNGQIRLSGFKVRDVQNKEFRSIGDTKNSLPFGWDRVKGGKFLVLVEGECDAAAAKDLLWAGNKDYNVCSVNNSGTVKKNLKYLSAFDSIVIAYDQDKVGKEKARKDGKVLEPGQAKIASWKDHKDANDILRADDVGMFLSALYNAKEYRPDGIVRLSQAWDSLWEDDSIQSILYPWDGLNDKLYGLRPKEIVTITGGSGGGKSAICREIEADMLAKIPIEDNIGILALEESIGRTNWGLMSIAANLPLHIREERPEISREDYRKWWDATVGTGRYIGYDHFGSTSSENLISQIRYMVKAMDCRWIFLDHLSIVVSDMDESGDERRTIDTIMTKLRQLTEETGASLCNVVHLRRMSGDKGHERGGEVTLNQLRGSHSIAQLSDAVISGERDQQSDCEFESNLLQLRVLKNRYAGMVGPAGWLYYDRKTGRLTEVHDKEAWLSEMKNEEF